ncbi:MAG: hypothetical protein PHW04_16940 [Candidatus Wallbacteria bacterium]|nr:hypothetical protein [Candidatus Wallbacteria bacterium]
MYNLNSLKLTVAILTFILLWSRSFAAALDEDTAYSAKYSCIDLRIAACSLLSETSEVSGVLAAGNFNQQQINNLMAAVGKQLIAYQNLKTRMTQIKKQVPLAEVTTAAGAAEKLLNDATAKLNQLVGAFVSSTIEAQSISAAASSYSECCTLVSGAVDKIDVLAAAIRKEAAPFMQYSNPIAFDRLVLYPLQFNRIYLTEINKKMQEILGTDNFGADNLRKLRILLDHTLTVVLDGSIYAANESFFASKKNEIDTLSVQTLRGLIKAKFTLSETNRIALSTSNTDQTQVKKIKDSFSKYLDCSSAVPAKMETLYNQLKAQG